MAEEKKSSILDVVNTRVVQLNAMVQGICAGLILGLAIFVATNWLILVGGHLGPEGQPIVGPHLSLLGQFFIGYRVTFVGSLIGFGYGAAIGFVGGYSLSKMYNWIAGLRERKR
ncbi:MAG: hypothetical protein ACREQP_02560 [Candidatus Binatia bacterium]